MPQERIHTNIPPFDVRVGWSRDRDVQVGVGEYEDRSLLWVLFGDEENRKRLARALPALLADLPRNTGKIDDTYQVSDEFIKSLFNLIESKTGPGEQGYTLSSVWSTLDRDECNKLIRLVRKARDQAFGRDE